MADLKKSTDERLFEMCKDIQEKILNCQFHDSEAENYLEVYDVKYIVNDDGLFQDCILMVAGGGPNIWIDTWSQEVQGFWGSDKVALPIYDYEHIKDYWEEQCVVRVIEPL